MEPNYPVITTTTTFNDDSSAVSTLTPCSTWRGSNSNVAAAKAVVVAAPPNTTTTIVQQQQQQRETNEQMMNHIQFLSRKLKEAENKILVRDMELNLIREGSYDTSSGTGTSNTTPGAAKARIVSPASTTHQSQQQQENHHDDIDYEEEEDEVDDRELYDLDCTKNKKKSRKASLIKIGGKIKNNSNINNNNNKLENNNRAQHNKQHRRIVSCPPPSLIIPDQTGANANDTAADYNTTYQNNSSVDFLSSSFSPTNNEIATDSMQDTITNKKKKKKKKGFRSFASRGKKKMIFWRKRTSSGVGEFA